MGTKLCLMLAGLQMFTASCILHSSKAFQIIPHTPDYLLRSPDRHETPFPDVQRDYNNFIPGQGWIDLRPLMELRIENAYYEKGSPRKGLEGFIGTEVARYQVRSGELRLDSVQPMKKRPVDDAPVQELIPLPLLQARYYRLYFEIFNRAENTHGLVLLAANSKQELDLFAAQMDHPETVCGKGGHCAAFPEACSVSVEMKITVNGSVSTPIWGSLLTSVVGDHPRFVQMERLSEGRLRRVEVNSSDAGSLRLPLLPGDRIRWH